MTTTDELVQQAVEILSDLTLVSSFKSYKLVAQLSSSVESGVVAT